MTRRIIQIRNLIVGLLIGESVLLFGLYLLINHSMLFAFAVYALVKNIILFIIFAYLSYLLETNNMSVSEALNIDAKNALIFGGIALIQYDETRNVVWTSDLFKK